MLIDTKDVHRHMRSVRLQNRQLFIIKQSNGLTPMMHVCVHKGLQIQYCEAIGSSLFAIDCSYITGNYTDDFAWHYYPPTKSSHVIDIKKYLVNTAIWVVGLFLCRLVLTNNVPYTQVIPI